MSVYQSTIVLSLNQLNSQHVSPETLAAAIEILARSERPRAEVTANMYFNDDIYAVTASCAERPDELIALSRSGGAGLNDPLDVPVEILLARALALFRFAGDMFAGGGQSNEPLGDNLEQIKKQWRRCDLVQAASFTPLKIYGNSGDRLFFDPQTLLENLDLINRHIAEEAPAFPETAMIVNRSAGRPHGSTSVMIPALGWERGQIEA